MSHTSLPRRLVFVFLAARIPKPPNFFGLVIFFPTHKMNAFIVGVSPNEVLSNLINVITKTLREPIYLHVVSRYGG